MGTSIRHRVRTRRSTARSDIHALVRDAVRAEIRSLIGDPDYGHALRVGVSARLARSQHSKRAGAMRSAHAVIARLGLRV